MCRLPRTFEQDYVADIVDVKGTPGLPDGKYNLFIAKTNKGWRAVFESAGKIVKQDRRVKVSPTNPHGDKISIRPVLVITGGGQICLPPPRPYAVICIHLD